MNYRGAGYRLIGHAEAKLWHVRALLLPGSDEAGDLETLVFILLAGADR